MKNISEWCCKLTGYANEGYALADIQVHLNCGNCETDVIVKNPVLDIIVEDENNVRLYISEGDDCETKKSH